MGSVITVARLWEQVRELHRVRGDAYFLCCTSFSILVINFQIFFNLKGYLSSRCSQLAYKIMNIKIRKDKMRGRIMTTIKYLFNQTH